jgi:hypothetical protein
MLEIEFAPALVEGQVLKIDAWMSQHGHGTRPVTLTVREGGIIEVSKLFFVMPGEWLLRAYLTDESNYLEKAEMPVKL